MFTRRILAVFTLLFMLTGTIQSFASCGPPECCGFPRKCGRGPKIATYYAEERDCQIRAAYSVDGRLAQNPRGYPHLVLVNGSQVAAEVWWHKGACTVKYKPGFFQ